MQILTQYQALLWQGLPSAPCFGIARVQAEVVIQN